MCEVSKTVSPRGPPGCLPLRGVSFRNVSRSASPPVAGQRIGARAQGARIGAQTWCRALRDMPAVHQPLRPPYRSWAITWIVRCALVPAVRRACSPRGRATPHPIAVEPTNTACTCPCTVVQQLMTRKIHRDEFTLLVARTLDRFRHGFRCAGASLVFYIVRYRHGTDRLNQSR
jgi:hypothetical protein